MELTTPNAAQPATDEAGDIIANLNAYYAQYEQPGVQVYNKAVRDFQPRIIRGNGHDPLVITLEPDDWAQVLTAKLAEEVEEFAEETDPLKRRMELADVLSVIKKLAEYNGGWEAVVAAEAIKTREKGGFDDRQYLVSVTRP